MEDLGSGLRLDQFLQGDDPAASVSTLIEFAAIHGRLHAETTRTRLLTCYPFSVSNVKTHMIAPSTRTLTCV